MSLGRILAGIARLPGKAVGAAADKASDVEISLAVRRIRNDKEMGPVFEKVIKAANHKAIYTAAVVTFLPKIAAGVAAFLIAVHTDPMTAAKYAAYIGGPILGAVVFINRLVKWADDQTPD